LKALNDQEIEAVLGHELTHIRNGDVQLMVIAVIIAGVVGFFAELFFRSFTNFGWGYGRGRSYGHASVIFGPRQPGIRRRRGYRHHYRGGADRSWPWLFVAGGPAWRCRGRANCSPTPDRSN